MVARLFRAFGDPKKPDRIHQVQFDGAQEDLIRTAGKEWHAIDRTDYWHYLLDLCYVELDQELFDYLFPAFLIRWWEGQLDRTGGPESECDFYRAIDCGGVLTKMLDETRRTEILSWMVDAYMDGVDSWGGHLSVVHAANGWDNLHGPLWSFNALGQSVPILAPILDQLAEISTEGRAQWWLVFATGLIWNENESPYRDRGGGGVNVCESVASIYDHGFLGENHNALAARLTYEVLLKNVRRMVIILESSTHKKWSVEVLDVLQKSPERISLRIKRLLDLLAKPDLGGVLENPLDSPS